MYVIRTFRRWNGVGIRRWLDAPQSTPVAENHPPPRVPD
jgi:hypothetical protein